MWSITSLLSQKRHKVHHWDPPWQTFISSLREKTHSIILKHKEASPRCHPLIERTSVNNFLQLSNTPLVLELPSQRLRGRSFSNNSMFVIALYFNLKGKTWLPGNIFCSLSLLPTSLHVPKTDAQLHCLSPTVVFLGITHSVACYTETTVCQSLEYFAEITWACTWRSGKKLYG